MNPHKEYRMYITNTRNAVHRILLDLLKDDRDSVPFSEIEEQAKRFEAVNKKRGVIADLEEMEVLRLAEKLENDEWALTGAGQVFALSLEWLPWHLRKHPREAAPHTRYEELLESDREFLAACEAGKINSETIPDFLEQVTRAKQRFYDRQLFAEALKLRNIEQELQEADLRLSQ